MGSQARDPIFIITFIFNFYLRGKNMRVFRSIDISFKNSFILLSCLVSFITISSSAFSYTLDIQGGFRTAMPLDDKGVGGDEFAFLPLDIEVYRKVIPNLHLGLGYQLYYHSTDAATIMWHQFSLESTYKFMTIKKRFQLYGKFELGLFSIVSFDYESEVASILEETTDSDTNIVQPNFSIGPGCRFKILKRFYAYTEVLVNYYTVESTVNALGQSNSQKNSSMNLVFTGGVFYTI